MKIIYKDGHVDECPQDQELHGAPTISVGVSEEQLAK